MNRLRTGRALHRTAAIVGLVAACLALGSCGAPAAATGESVTVFAATSLRTPFTAIADDFMAANPRVTVTLNFGPSSSLARQVVDGAPADVFAAANEATMRSVSTEGLGEEAPSVFAYNRLEIAVPPGNPGMVRGLNDFADASKTLTVCAIEVPCGASAARVFADAGVDASIDHFAPDVAGARTLLELGEVDAALVYHSEVVLADGTVAGIAFPEALDARNACEILPLKSASDPALAAEFVAWVLGPRGQAALEKAGFDHG